MISFKRYYRQLNESFVKFAKVDGKPIELSKNESLSRLMPDVRGIIFQYGELITGTNVKISANKFSPIIHYELYTGYTNNRIKEDLFYEMSCSMQWINIQRYENSNRFYLGESYDRLLINKMKSDTHVVKMIDICQKFNPDKLFLLESIRSTPAGRTIYDI